MISLWDLVAIVAGYLAGVAAGFWHGISSGRDKFWRMPGASWKVRK